MLDLTWLLIAVPLASAFVLLLAGKRANPWGHWLGVAASSAGFVVALIAWFVLRLLGNGAVIGAPTPEQRFVTEVRAQVDTTQSDDELLALGEWTCEAIEGGKMALAAVIVGSGMSSYQVGVVAGVATTHLCPDLADEMEAILDSVESGG